MALHIWSVLCERVLVNTNDQRVSLIDLVESIVVPHAVSRAGAGIRVNLHLVSQWIRSDEDEAELGSVRIDVSGPDGEPMTGSDIAVDLRVHARSQSVGKIDVVPFMGIGRYAFHINYRSQATPGWAHLTDVPFDVLAEGRSSQKPPKKKASKRSRPRSRA